MNYIHDYVVDYMKFAELPDENYNTFYVWVPFVLDGKIYNSHDKRRLSKEGWKRAKDDVSLFALFSQYAIGRGVINTNQEIDTESGEYKATLWFHQDDIQYAYRYPVIFAILTKTDVPPPAGYSNYFGEAAIIPSNDTTSPQIYQIDQLPAEAQALPQRILEQLNATPTLDASQLPNVLKEVHRMAQQLAAAYCNTYHAHSQQVAMKEDKQTLPAVADAFATGSALVSSCMPLYDVLGGIQNAASGAKRWEFPPNSPPFYTHVTETGSTILEVIRDDKEILDDKATASLWEQVRGFTDMDGDVALGMIAQLLKGPLDDNRSTWFFASNFLDYRGIKPMMKADEPGGKKWRAGHRQEDIQQVAESIARVGNIWLTIDRFIREEPAPGKRNTKKRVQYTHKGRFIPIDEVWYQQELPAGSSLLERHLLSNKIIMQTHRSLSRDAACIVALSGEPTACPIKKDARADNTGDMEDRALNATPVQNTNTSTPTDDNSPSSPKWTLIRQIRDDLANKLRRHEAGQDIDAAQVLAKARGAITQGLPIAVTPDMHITDYSTRDLLTSYWEQVTRRRATATTGFTSLNEALSGGIESKRLVVVLGAPNCGKTTFVHQMADHIADSGRPVLYVTSEDGSSELLAKTLARIGNVTYTAVLKGWETERSKINAALACQFDRISTDRLRYLDASFGITMETIREKAQAHFERYSASNGGSSGVLVIDYLQRIARAIKTRSGSSQDLREVVTQLTEQLRALACELDCGVIAIASQHRNGYNRSADSSGISSAKESGDIEYTADVMLALGDDKDRKKTQPHLTPVALYIDKNRQGAKGKRPISAILTKRYDVPYNCTSGYRSCSSSKNKES